MASVSRVLMNRIKKLYINGRFLSHSFNLYGYWNTGIYKLYKFLKPIFCEHEFETKDILIKCKFCNKIKI